MAGLTDEQMAALEAKHAGGGLTDDELEAKAKPGVPAAPEKSRAERLLAAVQGVTEWNPTVRMAGYVTHPDRARSALMGITSNAAPRALAGLEGIKGALTPGETFSGAYDKALPEYQQQYLKAARENPADNLGGAMLQPNPLSKVKAATTIGKIGLAGARTAQSATLGGLSEYLAGGDRGAVTDSAIKSGAVQSGLEALSPVAGKVAGYFGGKAAAAETAKRLADHDEMVATAKGLYGQKVQDANRTLENIRTALADPAVSPALKAQAQAFQKTPAYAQLVEQVGKNTLEAAPGKLGEMASLKQGLADAPAAAKKASDDYFAQNMITKEVLPRVAHYGRPLAAAAIGGAIAGPAGAGGGALFNAAIGKPGRAAANMVKSPLVQVQGGKALASGAQSLEGAATAPGHVGFEQWLTKKPDDEREQEGADYFTKATGGR